MKNVVLMVVIGCGAIIMLSGCGQKTPKEEVRDLTYNVLVDEKGVSEKRAECIANKTVEKLSKDDSLVVSKAYANREAGEILSLKYGPSIYTYSQKLSVAVYECI